MMKQTIMLALAGAWLAHAGFAVADEPFFMGLGPVDGYDHSYGTGISADGGTIIGGASIDADRVMPAYWTLEEGWVPLGFMPGGDTSWTNGVSADGSVIVGTGKSAHTPEYSDFEAFKWTAETGMVGLGDLPGGPFESRAHDVTADGSTVVGSGTTSYVVPIRKAVSWTGDDPPEDLGALPSDLPQSGATAISADGSVIVGWSRNETHRDEAFILTDEGGMVGLGNIEGTTYHDSMAWDVAANTEVVVGWSQITGGQEAFRWTEQTGMVGLGDLPGGNHSGQAKAVSGDGSVVVGFSSGDPGGAFIWDEQHGMRRLQTVLTEDYGLDLTGWAYLTGASGISDDGLTIIGSGSHNGVSQAWIAHIPEPTTLVFTLVGVLLAERRREVRHGVARR
jgi:probable HAF family extracellular repeat protein